MAPTPLDIEMKAFEHATDQRIDGSSICLIRLDGVGFSKYTRQSCFEKPFSKSFAQAMLDTARALCDRFNVECVYTSSDEITMVLRRSWDLHNVGTVDAIRLNKVYKPYIYNGRVQKLASISAATATAAFNEAIHKLFTDIDTPKGIAMFDARVFTVPDEEAAVRNIQWRSSHDAARNSFSKLAQHFLGPRKLHDLSRKALAEELYAKFKVSWTDLDTHYRYGTLVHKQTTLMKCKNQKTGEMELVFRWPIVETPLTEKLVKDDTALLEFLFQRL